MNLLFSEKMPGKKAPNNPSENGLGPISKVLVLPAPDVTERQQRENNPQNVEIVEVILIKKKNPNKKLTFQMNVDS